MKKAFFVDSRQMWRFVNHGEKQVGIHVTWRGKGLTQHTSTTELCLPARALGHRTGWAPFIVHPDPEAEQTWRFCTERRSRPTAKNMTSHLKGNSYLLYLL